MNKYEVCKAEMHNPRMEMSCVIVESHGIKQASEYFMSQLHSVILFLDNHNLINCWIFYKDFLHPQYIFSQLILRLFYLLLKELQ